MKTSTIDELSQLFICPTDGGWSVHARGISEILRLRGPETANTPAWRHLISRLRIICVRPLELSDHASLKFLFNNRQTLEALTKRKAQYLEGKIWQMFAPCSDTNDALDEGFQLIADVPALPERATSLPSIVDSSALLNNSATVVRSILAAMNSVESWHAKFWASSPTPRSWQVPSRASNPADVDPSDKTFPFCFEFESIGVALPVTICWALAAQLWSNVIQIYELLRASLGRDFEIEDLVAQAEATVEDATRPMEAWVQGSEASHTAKGRSIEEIRREGTRMARYVCQTMEYHHRIEMGTYGGHAITYPCWSARQYFRLHPGHERELSWLQSMYKMEGSGTRWGLSTMTFTDIAEPLAVELRRGC